ncbi:hypothetical protein OKW35_007522 [Paraburkholderia sp. MM5477-R1]
MTLPTVKVAAAHVASVYMNAPATVQKALSLIEEASRNGAELISFPESFIPGFPVWAALWAPIYNHEWFKRMVGNSIHVDGPEIALIRAAAKRCSVFVSMGFSEATDVSVGCLWNSIILIGDDGQIINHHRKLVPTFYEKMVWAPGDGFGLKTKGQQHQNWQDRRAHLWREHKSPRPVLPRGAGRADSYFRMARYLADTPARLRHELRQPRGKSDPCRRSLVRGEGLWDSERRIHGRHNARRSPFERRQAGTRGARDDAPGSDTIPRPNRRRDWRHIANRRRHCLRDLRAGTVCRAKAIS